MNNNSSKTNTNPQIQSFLESLRQRSGGAGPKPEMPFNPGMERFQEKKRLEELRRAEFFRTRQREFNSVYSHTKQSETQQIEQIQEKLRALGQSIKNLDNEVHNATLQSSSTKTQGVYHKTFLEHLSEVIELLKVQVDSSSSWLHSFNQRSNQKGYYWGMVGKKGTSFMLNNERQVATSVG